MLARVLAMALCLKEIRVSPKIRALPSRISPKLRTYCLLCFEANKYDDNDDRKFCLGISIVETCCRRSLRKVDAQSVINWTVVVDRLS